MKQTISNYKSELIDVIGLSLVAGALFIYSHYNHKTYSKMLQEQKIVSTNDLERIVK